MPLDIVLTIAGFALLTWGADRFVAGAGGIATLLGVPPVLVGLTIVGFTPRHPKFWSRWMRQHAA